MAINWNPLTQRCEEIDYNKPILLTPQQYVDQLRVGSDEWFKESEDESGRGILVKSSVKWTLADKLDDCNIVVLRKGNEIKRVSAQEFVDQWSFDHKA